MQLCEELNISFFEKGCDAGALEFDIDLSQREAEWTLVQQVSFTVYLVHVTHRSTFKTENSTWLELDNYKGQKLYFISFECKNRSRNYSAAVSSFCSSS